MVKDDDFKMPPKPYNANQKLRKAGFEIEFAGLEFNDVADIIIKLFGGHKEEKSKFVQSITGTRYGGVKLEFDSRMLKEKRYETFFREKLGLDLSTKSFKDDLEDVIASVSSHLVPFEVVLPPIPVTEFIEVEKLREALFENHAVGTTASPFFAFAFHINMEIPDDKTETIINYLKAFLLLQFWLFEENDVNFTRKHLTAYINYFPNEYLLKVLQKSYRPSLDQLIEDYKNDNPTRNRPLDMYPLFTFLKGRGILDGVEKPDLIKPRPTFHYRLPDCLIDDPSWRMAQPWNSWIEVEKLAYDEGLMNDMIDDFNELYNDGILNFKKNWIKKLNHYLR